MIVRAVLAALLIASSSLAASATPVRAPHVEVALIAEDASIQPGRDLAVGLRFALDDGWHVYWRNAGDSGEPPSVEWTLPEGFEAGGIEWPTPMRIPVGPLVNFGYEGDTLLPVRMRVPEALATGEPVTIGARVEWLVCDRDECIPGTAPLSLTLPVAAAPPRPSHSAALFATARGRMPAAAPPEWRVTAHASDDTIALDVRGAVAPAGGVRFFPATRPVIEHAAPQRTTVRPDGFRILLTPATAALEKPTALDGVLEVGDRAYAIAAPVEVIGAAASAASGEVAGAAASAASDPSEAVGDAPSASAAPDAFAGGDAVTDRRVTFHPLVLAFAGGLLLNLMPCVFPVLAFKALALVGLAGDGMRRARWHGLLYALGIVTSFWVLAGLLLALRAGGAQLGWGFQLQSPVVIALLASLFFWMALTLLGVSTVGASLMGVGHRLTVGGGGRAAFYTGVLATVVATPCTAPFMGTALGYALVQPPAVALAVFTALGLGLAFPYVLVTWIPSLGTHLPRPGRWMETLEQLLAFPLLATVVWLVWVASLQAGPEAVAVILGALVLLGLAAWTVRRWPGRPARLAAAGLVVVALAIQTTIAPREPIGDGAASPEASAAGLMWERYSAARLGELLQTGKPVFVDFTAAWCVTCQVNERVALATPAVIAKMRALGVIPVRADWTRPDPEIARALQEFGREGVPLYVLYSGRKEDPPRILPQILTTDIVLSELAELETRRDT